ncbi:aquaporin NIP6-1-like [Vigna angularis]|uniref:aquaporin NIP6-1-like n=1 Tax=Phaseolus angularis TaxID=3914 RepID=UPI0022B3E1ED|nr:aquaporin NIP6-1-like [Vigna angularis]
MCSQHIPLILFSSCGEICIITKTFLQHLPPQAFLFATSGTSGVLLSRSFTNANNTTNNTNKNFLPKCCRCLTLDDRTIKDGALSSVSCSLSLSLLVPLARKVGAEFIGTIILMFVATTAAIVNEKTNGSEALIGCATTTGLAVMILIFATGHISSAHFNPVVILSFVALKQFPWKHVPMYIGAQILASICPTFALKWVYHPFMSGGVTIPLGGYAPLFALEFIPFFNLMFVVTAIATVVATDTRVVSIFFSSHYILQM